MSTIEFGAAPTAQRLIRVVGLRRSGRVPRSALALLCLLGMAALLAGTGRLTSTIQAAVRAHAPRRGQPPAAPLGYRPGTDATEASYRSADCESPANPIAEENCRPGSDGWQVEEPSYTIAGFPLPSSVDAGGDVDFFVSTDAAQFEIRIYRSGYYDGKGARLVQATEGIRGVQQPPCLEEPSTGLRSCANWKSSYRLEVPADWVSGIYLAVLTRSDDGRQSSIPFVVRDDRRQSDILYQYSLSTYQAYNNYGGKSLYSFNSGRCTTVSGAPRAVKVSLARPHIVPPMDPTSYFRVEYPMVFWLESQGYDVSYSTSFDTHHSGLPGKPNALLGHRAFLAVGHDEYWSREMRDAMTQARDAGVHLAFFTGNTGYWKIRMESDPWTGQEDLVMVTYKTAEGGPADPSGDPTSLWRDPNGPALPENALVGIQFVGDNDSLFFPLRIPADVVGDPVFRNTGLEHLSPGTYVDIGRQLVGWEWDAKADNGLTPDGLTVLSASPAFGDVASDDIESYRVGTAVSNASRYTAPSSAIVFAAGTIQWSWGLAIVEPDRRLQQLTYNILSDMGVQPGSPSTTLILDGMPTAASGGPVPAGVIEEGSPEDLEIQGVQSAVDGQSAEIHWKTDRPASGEAWLVTAEGATLTRIQGGGPALTEDSLDGLSHRVRFESLQPAAIYHYVVAASADGGVFGMSSIQEFSTPPASLPVSLRLAAEERFQQAVCVIKPVARPAYSWIRAHMLATVLIVLTALALALIAVLRRRRRPSPAIP